MYNKIINFLTPISNDESTSDCEKKACVKRGQYKTWREEKRFETD